MGGNGLMGKAGRPSLYSEELADTICERIADGESLRSICSGDDMPNKATVMRWLGANAEFSDQYARARDAQADSIFDEILDIADDARNDWMKARGSDGEDERYVLNGEHVQRMKLRIDARKWMASKLLPKKYGDRLDLNHSGSIDTMPEKAVDARLLELCGKAGISLVDGTEEPDPAPGTSADIQAV